MSRKPPYRVRSVGSQNQRRFQRYTVAHQRVVRLRPNSHAIELAFQAANVGYVAPVNGNQAVALLYARLLARAISVHPLGPQMAGVFHPPDTVVGGDKLPLFLKINPREDNGGNA